MTETREIEGFMDATAGQKYLADRLRWHLESRVWRDPNYSTSQVNADRRHVKVRPCKITISLEVTD